ncbi:MAG: hypothetical protein GPOALKHO_000374 [Sodalis sp.]|uniref:hypothetical protein n=1 Tax=Sodalis sp. (in: enterobacteria) TaxID=1898979 RepID=UPI003872D690|nr:MAG: hypothetical protein GPOALKHO_000374 [Sodalis sp.]
MKAHIKDIEAYLLVSMAMIPGGSNLSHYGSGSDATQNLRGLEHITVHLAAPIRLNFLAQCMSQVPCHRMLQLAVN